MNFFLVGGAVRDKLLGHTIQDKDWVVVGATPEQMLEAGYTPVGKDFPVFLHPQTKEEYALARTERKTGKGYTGFSFYAASDVTLEDDLARRDLTINAIAETPAGKIIDPYNGQADIKQRVLRHVTDAFSEDPVRILRVARFAARFHHLGFTIAEETQQLMRDMVSNGEADHLVAERVWQEFLKALKGPTPHIFLQTLKETDALSIIMPEVAELVTKSDEPIKALLKASSLSKDPEIRFASLVHYLGEEKNKLRNLCKNLKVPSSYKDLAELTATHKPSMENIFNSEPENVLKLYEKADAFRRQERFEKFLQCFSFITQVNEPHVLTQYALSTLESLKEITPVPFLKEGYKGKELGEKIRNARLTKIEKSNTHK